MGIRWQRNGVWWVACTGLMALQGVAMAESSGPCPPRPLRIAFVDRDAPPFLRGTGVAFAAHEPGHMVDEVRATLQVLGCKGELVRLPAKRLQFELSSGRVDFGIGLGDTPERLALWKFPLQPDGQPDRRQAIGSSPVAWVVLARRQAALQAMWQSGKLHGRLGAATGSASSALAELTSLTVEPLDELARTVELLELGRFDAIALPVNAYAQLLRDAQGRVAVLQPAISTQQFYAPASLALAQRHGDFVRRFWSTLCDGASQRAVSPGCQRP